jgi:hypothetical protein
MNYRIKNIDVNKDHRNKDNNYASYDLIAIHSFAFDAAAQM